MVNREEKYFKAFDSVFFFGGKNKVDCLNSVSQTEFYVCLKCFGAIRVNICMANHWFTVV